MYIRTKDWIYDTENLHYRWIENNKVYKVGWDVEKPTFEADIINQSENLEELCDEFVIVLENADGQKIYSINYALCEAIKDKDLMIKAVRLKKIHNKDEDLKNEFNIYGAIWTDKGLIYVAKMNQEGELELI